MTDAQEQTIEEVHTTLTRLGRTRPRWRIVSDFIDLAIRHLNRETGELMESIDNRPSSMFPTRIFGDDADLCRVMDAYPYPCWAARPNNSCFHVNPLLVGFTGQPASVFTANGGGGWIDIIHPDDRKRVCLICRDGMQSLGEFQVFYRMRRVDGLWGWIEDKAFPYYRPEGHLVGYVGLMCVRGYERDPVPVHESIIVL